jgi:hypothetical protein
MQILLVLLMVMIVVLLLFFGFGFAADRAAELAYSRGMAEAMIIRAEGLASVQRAEAAVLMLYASVPLAVIALAIVAVVYISRRRPTERIVERYYVCLPQGPRRELWQAISREREPVEVKPVKKTEIVQDWHM